MVRIGILGNIGSGKSFVAKKFGYPVFDADLEVSKLYRKNKKIFIKLNKILPKYVVSFPIDKNQITKAILANNLNLKKIVNVVHKDVRKEMNLFLKRNKSKKFVVLDIPLLLENNINKKKDILIFVESKKKDIDKRIKKRPKFNSKLLKIFKKIQLGPSYKKKKSHFIIKNTFTKKPVKNEIMKIINKIL